MKIIVFQGGLGNQIFEYAYYSYLKINIKMNDFRLLSKVGTETTQWF